MGPPDGEAVHYFFNPFSREVFAEVLHNIVVSYRKRPRRLYLILIEPVATDLSSEWGVRADGASLPREAQGEAVQSLRDRDLPLSRVTAVTLTALSLPGLTRQIVVAGRHAHRDRR